MGVASQKKPRNVKCRGVAWLKGIEAVPKVLRVYLRRSTSIVEGDMNNNLQPLYLMRRRKP